MLYVMRRLIHSIIFRVSRVSIFMNLWTKRMGLASTIILKKEVNKKLTYIRDQKKVQYTPDNSNLQGTDENGSS